MEKRALISVYDKTGAAEIAGFLIDRGFSLISTGGTRLALEEAGLAVEDVSNCTGADEILGGRVKSLHPAIHGGILARRDDPGHMRELTERGIAPIDVVVVNLYPFLEKSGENMPPDELLEFIDIGGPAMIRAAAKNHPHVAVISSPGDYPGVMDEWRAEGCLSSRTRRRLAAEVFALTAAYDAAIAASLASESQSSETPAAPEAPERLTFSYRKADTLRYGENPHQSAAWYVPAASSAFGALSDLVLHQGKPLSFNNLRDLDAAWRAVSEFESPACIGVKHAAPCGAALASSPAEAWTRTREADPVSIFGGVAAFNREVDQQTADLLMDIFLEVIAAPAYTSGALDRFSRKKNLRVLTLERPPADQWEALPVDGGICLQTADRGFLPPSEWRVPTRIRPTEEQQGNLEFAWRVVKHVKSNGIVLAARRAVAGIGGGQPNRVGAVNLAVSAAGEKARGAVMASDAFFPFGDAVEAAARAGITAVIQPGGSLRDEDSIKACDEAGIAMVFTGRRHFRH